MDWEQRRNLKKAKKLIRKGYEAYAELPKHPFNVTQFSAAYLPGSQDRKALRVVYGTAPGFVDS